MGNKYRKIKFSIKKELIIILAIVVVLIVATLLLQIPSKENKFISKWQQAGSTTMTEEYSKIFAETSFDSLDNLISSNDEVVVLYAKLDQASATLVDEIVEQHEQLKNELDEFDFDKVYIIYATDADDSDALKAKYGLDNDLDSVPAMWVFENKNADSSYELSQTLVKDEKAHEAVKQLMLYVLQ